jgi:hypothetical protein
MKKWLRNNWLYFVGALVGAATGFFYWKFDGCANGTCAITSSPINSTLYFAIVGALFFSIFKKENKPQSSSPKKGI